MGEGQSKLKRESRFSQSRDSLNSTKDIITSPRVEFYQKNVKEIQEEIENITGILSDLKYESYQVTLTNYSKEIQNLKTTLKKKRVHLCDEILKNISYCCKLLVDKKECSDFLKAQNNKRNNEEEEVEAEQTEKENITTPVAKTESVMKQPLQTEQPQNTTLSKRKSKKSLRFEETVLEQMSEKVLRLQQDIDASIELELDMNYKEYENIIKEYYTELELISNPNHLESVRNTKESLCKILIRYNNKIRKYKAAKRNKPSNNVDPQLLQTLYDIQNKLKEFAKDIDESNKESYNKIQQYLIEYETKVSSIDETNPDMKTLKNDTLNQISKLQCKLNEQQSILRGEETRQKLNEQLKVLTDLVEEFHGTMKDDTYLFLDQNLRKLWSKLNIDYDKHLIEQVKNSLALLNAKVQKSPDNSDGAVFSKIKMTTDSLSTTQHSDNDVIEPPQIYKNEKQNHLSETEDNEYLHSKNQIMHQIREFETHWHQLYFNIKQSEITDEILELLEHVFETISKNSDELAEFYNSQLSENDDDSVTEHEIKYNSTVVSELNKIGSEASSEQENKTDATETVAKSSPLTKDESQAVQENGYVYYENENQTTEDIKPRTSVLKKSYTFTDLQTIQKEVNNISKELFSEKINPYDLKQRLDEQKNFLKTLQITNNETLERTKVKVLKNIEDTYNLVNEHFKFLQKDKVKGSLSELRIYEDNKLIQDLKDTIKNIEERIKQFKAVERNEEYRCIEKELEEVYDKVQSITTNNEEMEELSVKIKTLNEELPIVLVNNQTSYVRRNSKEINELKAIIEEVQELKRKFGTLDNNYLKTQLEKCLENIDAIDDKNNEKAHMAKVQIKQKILKYLKNLVMEMSQQQETVETIIKNNKKPPDYLKTARIIEGVSVPSRINSTMYNEEQTAILQNSELQKAEHAERVVLPLSHPENPYQQIEEIRRRLIDIKTSMDCFKGNYKDPAYNVLEDRIFQIGDDLNKVNDNGSKLIRTSKAQYKDYIAKLLRYFEATVSGSVYYTTEETNLKELNKTKEKLERYQEKVEAFNGTKDEYLLLKEEILAEKVNLQYLTLKDNDELSKLKENLLTFVIKILKTLKGKSNRYSEVAPEVTVLNELINIKNDLKEIEDEINQFSGTKNDEKYKKLDEALINLVIRLDSLEVNDDNIRELKDTKGQLILQIQTNMNLLHDKTVLPTFIKSRKSELLTTDI